MAKEFKTPDPGEGIHEVEIVELYVSEGDSVSEGDDLMAVESDKATIDVPSPFTGTVESLEVAPGDVVEVGTVLLTYAEDGDGGAGADEARDTNAEAKADEDDEPDQPAGDEEEAPKKPGKDEKRDKQDRKQEKQEKRAKKQRKRDKAAEDESEAADREDSSSGKDHGGQREQSRKARSGAADVEASPATRRLARELDVDLADVPGSGPGGRVMGRDVRNAVRNKGREGHRAAASVPDFSRWGEVSREPLRGIRRATARRMSESWREIPHVSHTQVADVTRLEAFRREHVGDLEAKLTLTVLAVKALAAALRRFPRFNASLDPSTDEVVYKHYCHIGVAVATEQGLLVPVLRDADRKTLRDLAAELEELGERARNRKLSADDMKGGSMSITNVGGIGGDHFSPIINYPEAAILGLAALREVPVLTGSPEHADRRVEGRLHLPLILAFDHRLNDGMDAAQFANAIAESLSDPETLLLEA